MKIKAKALMPCLAVALLAAFMLASCSDGGSKKNDDEAVYTPAGDSGTASGSVVYTGAITAGGTSYTSLSLNGNSSSGTAVLSGTAGDVTGSYSRTTAAAANTLDLSGKYTLTFGFGSITASFGDGNASLSAGSVAASGSTKKLPDAGSKGLVVGKYYVSQPFTHNVCRSGTGTEEEYVVEYEKVIYKNRFYFKITEDGKAEFYVWGTDADNNWRYYHSLSSTYSIDGNTITFKNTTLGPDGNPCTHVDYSATKTDDSSFKFENWGCYETLSTYDLITFKVQDAEPSAGIVENTGEKTVERTKR